MRSLVDQLDALYGERELLLQTLGVAQADDIIALVRSLRDQLQDVYAERDALKEQLQTTPGAATEHLRQKDDT